MPKAGGSAGGRGLALGPRRVEGARPLLFERLFGEPAPRLHDAAGLSAAIVASLTDLMSVRPPASAHGAAAASRTVLDYGAAPAEGLSPARPEDRARLAADIRAAIAAFEPRLESPEVEIVADPDAPGEALARVTGSVRLGRSVEPFAFLAPLRAGGGAP